MVNEYGGTNIKSKDRKDLAFAFALLLPCFSPHPTQPGGFAFRSVEGEVGVTGGNAVAGA
ncbi:hypothetical protein P6166_03855 [Stenotrophomonas sp. HITSZ_GD]|uniref:hypothetical protein n=1 Tax=Stenotrophomonas sp. HITSZ_GD TaxID=3037248 RepID=UPI00240CEFE5|nr:hypothetical protein [Stenotrophomonas sp. HITSZ_GD]MDG2524493.1 hypothetical protein [Stenotrophomonas sp. HITSZ_GD]